MNIPEDFDPIAFISKGTSPTTPSILPEMQLYLATELTPLWQLTEIQINDGHLAPPFWAFAWPGGQGVARYILDNPETVRGKRVLDFAAGSGLGAIAAMKAGAKQATAVDIDYLALNSIAMNAELNKVSIDVIEYLDTDKPPKNIDLIITGDVCYQQAMAAHTMRWLWLCVASGIRVIMGDPGRAYIPTSGVKELASYTVPTSRDIESDDSRFVRVWDVGLPIEES